MICADGAEHDVDFASEDRQDKKSMDGWALLNVSCFDLLQSFVSSLSSFMEKFGSVAALGGRERLGTSTIMATSRGSASVTMKRPDVCLTPSM